MLLFNIIHNRSSETASQIQIFKPKQVTKIFNFFKNRLDIGYAGKIGETKQTVHMPA
ncbi:hypothetical protein SDC9_98782 [bioreactor metagenome]|uniref:Uncharacterized protein n=1 Tax=bioreactor metagenome TaxID=1076179 RepID=A0A645AFR5_9ZZZZ